MSDTIRMISVNAATETVEGVDMSLSAAFAHYRQFSMCNFNGDDSRFMKYARSNTLPSDPLTDIISYNEILWTPIHMTRYIEEPHMIFIRYAWAPQDVSHSKCRTNAEFNRATPISFTEEEIVEMKSKFDFAKIANRT